MKSRRRPQYKAFHRRKRNPLKVARAIYFEKSRNIICP
jgi:hypothetical protein